MNEPGSSAEGQSEQCNLKITAYERAIIGHTEADKQRVTDAVRDKDLSVIGALRRAFASELGASRFKYKFT